MNIKLLRLMLCVIFLGSQPCYAYCDIGYILFRDTLFGGAAGAGVGALVQISNQSEDRIAANIATATLIGAGVGAAIGVTELSFSGCFSGGYNSSARMEGRNIRSGTLTTLPLLSLAPSSYVTNTSSNYKASNFISYLDNIQFKDLMVGVHLVYSFDN